MSRTGSNVSSTVVSASPKAITAPSQETCSSALRKSSNQFVGYHVAESPAIWHDNCKGSNAKALGRLLDANIAIDHMLCKSRRMGPI